MATPIARWAAPMVATGFVLAAMTMHGFPEAPIPLTEAIGDAEDALLADDGPRQWAAWQRLRCAMRRAGRLDDRLDVQRLSLRLGQTLLQTRPGTPDLLLQVAFQHLRMAAFGPSSAARRHVAAAADALIQLRIHAPRHPQVPMLERAIAEAQFRQR